TGDCHFLRATAPQTPPSSSHPYLPPYRRRPAISLIVERVMVNPNARLISVAVNPDWRRVMIMARCRLLTLALWCACPYNLPSSPSARRRLPTAWALRLGSWAAMVPADTLPASSRMTVSSFSVQRLTAGLPHASAPSATAPGRSAAAPSRAIQPGASQAPALLLPVGRREGRSGRNRCTRREHARCRN